MTEEIHGDDTFAKAKAALDLNKNPIFMHAIKQVKESIFWEFCESEDTEYNNTRIRAEMSALTRIVEELNGYIIDAQKAEFDEK